MRRSGNAGRGSASARNEDGLMPIVPVSLPDSQAPPPDESVGPIAGGVQPHYLLGHQHFGVTTLLAI